VTKTFLTHVTSLYCQLQQLPLVVSFLTFRVTLRPQTVDILSQRLPHLDGGTQGDEGKYLPQSRDRLLTVLPSSGQLW